MKEIDRRGFLKYSLLGAVGLTATACGIELRSPIVGSAPASTSAVPKPTNGPDAAPRPTVGIRVVETGVSDLSSLNIPFPELVKYDPQVAKTPNLVFMLFDPRDKENPLVGLGDKVTQFAADKKWNIMGKINQWGYMIPVVNGKGETGTDTWAVATNILKKDNLSVYEKPGVTGQLWFRVPRGVSDGQMTMAFAVNENFVNDKTDGDPNRVPSVDIRSAGVPGRDIAVNVMYVKTDGTRTYAQGHMGVDTDNIMVNLAPKGALTVVSWSVNSALDKQQEGHVEYGSDTVSGHKFNNEALNRIRVEQAR